MNSYLLNRALGTIAPSTFHTAQTARLVHHLEPAPGIRFSSKHQAEFEGHGLDTEGDIYAHRAGTNVLAVDQYDGRWWVDPQHEGNPWMFWLNEGWTQYGIRRRRRIDPPLGSREQRE